MKDQRTGRIGKLRYPLLVKLIGESRTASEIADVLNVNPETVRKFARVRALLIRPDDMSLDNHPCWKGGTTKDRSGYILQRVAKNGEYGYLIRAIQKRGKAGTDPNGYAPTHRIVMHNTLGRKLNPGEVVDHIDGNIENNSPKNLRVFASNKEHLQATLAGRVPNWTPEGFSRITGRPKKNQ